MAPRILSRISTFLGVSSLHAAGTDAYLIITLRSLRMLAAGIPSLILALFFSSLDFPDTRIGLFMTLTLFGDVLLSLVLTLIADSLGRRKVLLMGSVLMVASGIAFAVSENFWVLLVAAVFGVISVTGADCGPFRAIEESVLSGLTNEETRSDVLTWYVTVTTFAGAVGTEVAGRVVHFAESKAGNEKRAFHVLFWGYAIFGGLACILCLGLSRRCEVGAEKDGLGGRGGEYRRVGEANDEEEEVMLQNMGRPSSEGMPQDQPQIEQPEKKRSYFSQVSRASLSTLVPLWALLSIDSLADGMTPYSLMNYYVSIKFPTLSKSTLGDITSLSQFLCAFSSIFAGPLSKRIGLINTMVFTHLPSSLASAFIPLPDTIGWTVALLLFRAALNSMDQAPRTAFIAAVVKPHERTGVMGITGVLRQLAMSVGPSITGILAGNGRFWAAFLASGICRVTYDLGLWIMFVNFKVGGEKEADDSRGTWREDEVWDELLGSDGDEDDISKADDDAKSV